MLVNTQIRNGFQKSNLGSSPKLYLSS